MTSLELVFTEALKLSNASPVLVFSYNIFTNGILFYNLFTYYMCPKEGHMYNLLTVLYIKLFAYVILYIYCYTEALKLSNASPVLVFSYNIFTNGILFYNLFTYYMCPKEGHMYNLLTVLYINMFAYVILYIYCYTEALKLSNASAVLVFSYNIFTNGICFYNLFTFYRCPKEGHMYNLLTVLYIKMFAYVILYI